MGNNFSSVHRAQLAQMLADLTFDNVTIATNKAGISAKPADLLNEYKSDSLKTMLISYEKQIEAIHNSRTIWDGGEVNKTAKLQRIRDFIYMAYGYVLNRETAERNSAQVRKLKEKLAQVEADAMTPEAQMAALKAEIALLES